jgi:hypothetical protein
LGESLKMPLYKFLKIPLIRKYGVRWYRKLEEIISENGSEHHTKDLTDQMIP